MLRHLIGCSASDCMFFAHISDWVILFSPCVVFFPSKNKKKSKKKNQSMGDTELEMMEKAYMQSLDQIEELQKLVTDLENERELNSVCCSKIQQEQQINKNKSKLAKRRE